MVSDVRIGYIREPVTQGRTDKTLDKVRRGGLPLCPADAQATLVTGNGRQCDGCGEPMFEVDRMYVAAIYSVAILRFHDDCYNAWASFTRQKAASMAPPSPLAALSILVVDDNSDNREMLETFLAHLGATVRIAATGEDGLEQFKAAPAAVVLADIAMPGRDGLWLLQEIRALAGGSRVPVIAVTGRIMPRERQALRDAGFNALVSKPITDLDGLAEMILAVIGQRDRRAT